GQDCPGRRIHPRLPAAARGPAERADDPAGADQGPGHPSATVIADNLITERGVSAGDEWITVPADNVHEALAALKGEGYRLLVFLTCVDHLVDQSRPSWPGRYELVYQLRDVEKLRELRVRAFVDGDPPEIESATDLFPPADWDERETYDLFGVRFKGHPELTRILMPDDWVGHPLRRDYPVGGEVVEFSEEHQRWQTPPDRA
ncbi:MAG: NADH-quinone oxidoreductase subunit C, partial [Chloroflexi bacterium]